MVLIIVRSTIQAQTFCISKFHFQTVLQMFSNQPTYQQQGTGKRISGLNSRKGEFSLAWDSGNNELNDFQRKKQKNHEVNVKLNYQEPNQYEVPKRISQGGYQQGDKNKFYQLESPYSQQPQEQPRPSPYGQYPVDVPKPPSSRNVPVVPTPPPAHSVPSYDEEEVLGYLRKYEHIDDMPPEQLEKVMAYYQSLKQPKSQPRAPPAQPQVYQMPPPVQQQAPQRPPVTPPQDNPYQRRSSSARKVETPNNYPPAERREPIRPRESAGGIIYGSSKELGSEMKPSSSYALKKNQATFVIGDGYNYFQEEAHRKALAEQQNQAYLRQQAEQPQQQFKSRGDPSKISNIFG